jgi:hypothetical protein
MRIVSTNPCKKQAQEHLLVITDEVDHAGAGSPQCADPLDNLCRAWTAVDEVAEKYEDGVGRCPSRLVSIDVIEQLFE